MWFGDKRGRVKVWKVGYANVCSVKDLTSVSISDAWVQIYEWEGSFTYIYNHRQQVEEQVSHKRVINTTSMR